MFDYDISSSLTLIFFSNYEVFVYWLIVLGRDLLGRYRIIPENAIEYSIVRVKRRDDSDFK